MFDLRRAQRAKDKLDRRYGKDAEKLRKAGKHQDHEYLLSEWHSEGRVAETIINAIVTQRLKAKANKLDLPLPSYPVHGHEEENELWEWEGGLGEYILTAKGRTLLRDAIRKEKSERFEERARWVTLTTGIIGAAIGLVSVLTNLVVRLLTGHALHR